MTRQPDCTLSEPLLEILTEQGLDALPQAMALLLNAAMKAERQKYLNAAPYERTPERTDQANGYKDKTITTRVGAMTVAVPQVRNREFYPASLERGMRSERALKLADWMETHLPEGLTVFAFPKSHRRLIRATNGLERLNQEVRRRTRVARLFPQEASSLRLVSAVLMEISEEGETGNAYLSFDD